MTPMVSIVDAATAQSLIASDHVKNTPVRISQSRQRS